MTDFNAFFPFYNNLAEDEKQLLNNNSTNVKYKQGDNVHNASENCIGVLLINSGALRVYMLSEDGREITLYRLFGGDICILSASCVLEAITFDVFIDAEKDTQAIMIPSSVFHNIMDKNIYARAFAYQLATQRFSDVMWAMQQILFMSFDKRLAIFLYDEYIKSSNTKIKLTHEQIAKYTGSAREVVTRMLKYFANENIVKLHRGEIELINIKKLKDLTA